MKMQVATKWAVGLAGLALVTGTALGQSSSPQTSPTGAAGELEAQARQTIDNVKLKYPSLDPYFQSAAGYAVFPSVTKGAAVVGGSHGEGILYENGQPVGKATVSKASVGAQLGGQSYSELIFFQNPQTLAAFKQGNYEFSAGTSAVAGSTGVGKALNYDNGVAVVTFNRQGLMAGASVGGQKFAYHPLPSAAPGNEGAVGGSTSPGGSANAPAENGTAPK